MAVTGRKDGKKTSQSTFCGVDKLTHCDHVATTKNARLMKKASPTRSASATRRNVLRNCRPCGVEMEKFSVCSQELLTGDKTTAAKRLRRRLVRYTRSICTRYTLTFSDKCHWAGSGDCVNNKCERHEMTLVTDWYGDSDTACNCTYSSRSDMFLVVLFDLG